MRSARWLLPLTVVVGLTVGERTARAEPLLSTLSEVITGNGAPIDSPQFFANLEPNSGIPQTFTIPALTIDFLEVTGAISDRFHFDDYTVVVTSVAQGQSLPPRVGAFPIPLQTFELLAFIAFSDGEQTPPGGVSDTLRIRLGNGIDTGDIPVSEPADETAPEQFSFTIFPFQFDVLRPDGTVSDYVDLTTNLNGFFLSSDNPADYDPTVIVNGTFFEDPITGGTMFYANNFNSAFEIVPEPASVLLFGTGLSMLGGYAWRRRRLAR